MSTHAVHSEGNQCKILQVVTPIEGTVKMSLRFEIEIVSTRHVVEWMLRSDSHEGDAIFELVADLDNLMLIHVKIVRRIIVPRNQLDEADGIG